VADCGLRDVQFGRRIGEAQMPGGRLEGAQSVERWQSGGHFPGDQSMNLCHVKRYKVSFVQSLDRADIARNRLALGEEHVHLHT
jgi:hypothetical protein